MLFSVNVLCQSCACKCLTLCRYWWGHPGPQDYSTRTRSRPPHNVMHSPSFNVCVRAWRKWDVCGAGLDQWRATFALLNLELREECSARAWAGIIQNSWEQLGSSSWSGRNRGAAVEASGSSSWSGRNRGAATEAGASGEQPLKRMQSRSSSWRGRNRGAGKGTETGNTIQLARAMDGWAVDSDASSVDELSTTKQPRLVQ